MIRSAEDALALLERHGVMPIVRAGAAPSLVDEVAGERVRGSWWAHPKGRDVYAILETLHDHPDVLVTRLIDGKNTLVHRSKWPLLLRVVLDEEWRTGTLKRLGAGARQVVALVNERGRLRIDELPPKLRQAKDSAADSLLVRVDQEHTETGRHSLVLESWSLWTKERSATPAAVAFLDAVRELEQLCGTGTLGFGMRK